MDSYEEARRALDATLVALNDDGRDDELDPARLADRIHRARTN